MQHFPAVSSHLEQMGSSNSPYPNLRTGTSEKPMPFTEWILKSRYAIILAVGMAILAWAVAARSEDLPVLQAVRINKAPVIDGALNDSVWLSGIPFSRFTQKNPDEYAAPTQKTEVSILYDNIALYIGARMFDTAPDSIDVRLMRRDGDAETDFIAVYLDPFHNHRSGYYFGVNSAGTCLDGVRYNDTWADDSWDGVWEGVSRRDSLGWSAEFRIPFSQIRFANQHPLVWGINFKRWIGRRNEENMLSFAPRSESGFVSRFSHLEGLADIPKPRYLEVLPYVRGQAHFAEAEAGDPFFDGSEFIPAAGTDLKLGVGSHLVLNATINPDFGQVEVDPAVVNLSDVETWFNEKRPFFVEGSKTFEFGVGGATNYWSSNWQGPTFFYSRRIGRAPQGRLPHYDFADVPDGAHILGAGKLTGRLKKDWNFGSLHAVTMREHADIKTDSGKSQVEIEPLTYYSATRGQKEIRNGFRGIGGMLTTAHRIFDDDRLKADINSDAFAGGVDGWTFLDRSRKYALTGWIGGSHVRGTAERITAVQRSSLHYFQRPDASHVNVDSSATSLSGWAMRVMLNKEKGAWMLNTAAGVISPGFDVNDVGYMSRADFTNTHLGGGYRWVNPTSWTRYADISTISWLNFDFQGNRIANGVWLGTSLQFLNYWWLNVSVDGIPQSFNNIRTRGGPLTVNRAGWEAAASFYSDARKPFVFNAGTTQFTVAQNHWTNDAWATVEIRPASNLSFSIGPNLSLANLWVQWVNAIRDPAAQSTYGKRYVFAAIRQTEVSASVRVNYTLTPKLSWQLYAQPYFSTGDYSDFRHLSKPRSFDFYTYPPADVHYSDSTDSYTIDPDGNGPAASFTLVNPDFDYTSLRGNMILRWEYRPGSALFLVWTHGQAYDENSGKFRMKRSLEHLFSRQADNILLIKASFWFAT